MPKSSKPENVAFYGYRWFQQSFGNTYWTSICFVDGVELFRSETMEYGYGNHWEHMTFKRYQEKMGVRADTLSPSMYFRNEGIVFHSHVTDGLKRDLLKFNPFG